MNAPIGMYDELVEVDPDVRPCDACDGLGAFPSYSDVVDDLDCDRCAGTGVAP